MAPIIEHITKAYTADQAKLGRALKIGELPLSYSEITNEWLSAALCKNHPGVTVTDHQLGPEDNGSSNRRRISITYSQAVDELPKNLFCKSSHDLANRIVLGVSGGAECEKAFYTDYRPHLNIEGPRCWYAEVDSNSFNSLIMLEDLTGHIKEFCDHRTNIDLEKAKSQVSLLATVHGRFFGDETLQQKLKKLPTWPEYFMNTLSFGMETGCKAGFLEAVDVIPPRLYARHTEIWDATLASVEKHKYLPRTLAHGDVHLKNWYVAKNGKMGITDWQCCSQAYWSRDFAYTISTALTVENRRAWERQLLTQYIEELENNGGPKLSFNNAWDAYRGQLVAALAWWTITLAPAQSMPDMQPRDTTLEFVKRIATALDDLDGLSTV